MLSQNIRYFRLKAGLSTDRLAEKICVGQNRILRFESGDIEPSMMELRFLARAMGVGIGDLLVDGRAGIEFVHHSSPGRMKVRTKTLADGTAERACARLFTIDRLFKGGVLSDPPQLHAVPADLSPEGTATALRAWLGLPAHGPVLGLIPHLERAGFLVAEADFEFEDVDAVSGLAGSRPYILISAGLTPERRRFAVCREALRHALVPDESLRVDADGKKAAAVIRSFFMPREDMLREFGRRRAALFSSLREIAAFYGMEPDDVLRLGTDTKVFSTNAVAKARDVLRRTAEHRSRVAEVCVHEDLEHPRRLRTSVLRAYDEELISASRAAELLGMSTQAFMKTL